MKRCVAVTKSGRRCLNAAAHGACCRIHKDASLFGDGLAAFAGAIAANAIAPGLGSVILGALAGKVVREIAQEEPARKKKIFVSFDFDHDLALKNFILAQTKHPQWNFEIIDHSLNEAAPERSWQEKARKAISKADIVLVMVGAQTYRAQGVLKEVAMARDMGVKVVQIIGYRNADYSPVPRAGRLYRWSKDNLKQLLT